jgi:class 3 adenylate cyclase/tetratricopeptide (TPR) repeat protein
MRFCGQCGARLGSACPSCGTSNPTEHKFCGQCGALLGGPGLQDSVSPEPYLPKPRLGGALNDKGALPGEMKQVSVLFCDIVGSTPMTKRLGAEAMRDLVGSFLKESLAEVHRYGGTAPQFAGDGFMALFGAPLAYEDHVRRCLLAALAIQWTLGGDAVGGSRLELLVRIGIHSGPVVFGPIGENLPMEYTAIGDTTNIAARLQQVADPGTILVSDATRRLAQGFARLESVGPLVLKGNDEPIVAYRLLGVSHRRSGLRESGSDHPTSFVDRYSELTILNGFFQQAESGRSQVVGVVGEPGIGKSRLLAEFHQQLVSGRASWVEGRCASYGTAIPYWLLLDLLRSNCTIIETDNPKTIIEKIRVGLREVGMDPERDSPVLLHLLGVKEVGDSSALSNPEAVKAKAFEIFRQLSVEGSRQRPLVLVLEDLHWVDKISEEFLGSLAENAPGAHILMLATYRPGYRPPWIDKSYAWQTLLQPLSRDDSRQMVHSVLSPDRLVDLVSEEIIAKAEGNPFFLEQLALHAGEAKDMRSDLMVPDTIHDVVMARIDRLPDETKHLLQTAAVIGREFSSRLLSAVWNDPGGLGARLRELSRLEFISERVTTEGSMYVFCHALTQETAYGSLLERHRRAHHAAVGHALEELYARRTDEVAELLALHFGRSDDTEKAIDYAIVAGEKAQRRWANTEALIYFNDALCRLDSLSADEANRVRRIDAVIKQADARYGLGQYTEYLQILQDIHDLVEETDEPRRRAVWHCWTGLLQGVTGERPDSAIEHCHQAARIASAHGLQEIDAFADSCLAQLYVVAGRLRDAIESGERALAYFEGRGDHWWAARTLWFLTVAANYLGEWDASLDYCWRGIEHGTALDSPLSRSVLPQGWARMGLAYIQQGNIERGLQCCNQALALAPILPRDSALAKVGRGYGQIKAGRFEVGFAELSEALAWQNRSGFRFTYLSFALFLAEGYLRCGDPASAGPLIQDVLEGSKVGGYLHIEGRACWLMAECLAGEGSAEAEGYVKRAVQIFERVGARSDFAKAMLTRAALCQKVGDTTGAQRLLERASTVFGELGTLDEPARVEAALSALDRGSPIALLSGAACETPAMLQISQLRRQG